jgi:hypothetical protein
MQLVSKRLQKPNYDKYTFSDFVSDHCSQSQNPRQLQPVKLRPISTIEIQEVKEEEEDLIVRLAHQELNRRERAKKEHIERMQGRRLSKDQSRNKIEHYLSESERRAQDF